MAGPFPTSFQLAMPPSLHSRREVDDLDGDWVQVPKSSSRAGGEQGKCPSAMAALHHWESHPKKF